jgi:DNA gyrase subunit B
MNGPDEKSTYTAKGIQVLKGLEAVRRRPAMYIGDTSVRGLHHLVYEVVDNAIDEAMAGYCDNIVVTIDDKEIISVKDNGRGIPVDMHKTEGKPALEVVMTSLHAGGKFDKGSYKVSGGLHGVGVSCVNALSVWLKAEVWRDGEIYFQEYHRGKPVAAMAMVGKGDPITTGTTITFEADPQIFPERLYSFETLRGRLRELAFLNRGLCITIEDKRPGKVRTESFHYEGGIVEYVRWLNEGRNVVCPEPVYFEGEKDGVQVEIAMDYNDGYSEALYTFANNINTCARRVDGHRRGQTSGTTVRRPDQNEARQYRGQGTGRANGQSGPCGVSRRTPARGQGDHQQVYRRRAFTRSGASRARPRAAQIITRFSQPSGQTRRLCEPRSPGV